jgi:hypothetical protein
MLLFSCQHSGVVVGCWTLFCLANVGRWSAPSCAKKARRGGGSDPLNLYFLLKGIPVAVFFCINELSNAVSIATPRNDAVAGQADFNLETDDVSDVGGSWNRSRGRRHEKISFDNLLSAMGPPLQKNRTTDIFFPSDIFSFCCGNAGCKGSRNLFGKVNV